MQYFASISDYTGTVAGIQSKKKGNGQDLTKYLISDCSSSGCLLYNLSNFRPRFGQLGRKARPFYFREFGITSHYFQRAGEKLLKKFRELGSTARI